MRLPHGVLVWLLSCILISDSVMPQVVDPTTVLPIGSLKLPAGFTISIFSNNVPNARSLTRSRSDNTGVQIVYVSTAQAGSVYAVIDRNNDGKGDEVVTVLSGLTVPNGVAWQDGSLYVGLINTILRYDAIDKNVLGKTVQNLKPVVISKGALPSIGWHGRKFIAVGPDNKLYVPVGAPCNVCECPKFNNISFCSITRMNLDGSNLEVFATGIRNTVGFDWHPKSKAMFFTDNGQDDLGPEKPDCELNSAPQPGLNFGFPYCHAVGKGPPALRSAGSGTPEPDPNLNPAGSTADCGNPTANRPPVQTVGPHAAPLGMRFYTGGMFPTRYANSAFVALHGSHTNGDVGIFNGYSVVNVRVDDLGAAVSYEPFISGWFDETKQAPWGRPVDVMPMPDGSMLVSDDLAGVVYRVAYGKSFNLRTDNLLYLHAVTEQDSSTSISARHVKYKAGKSGALQFRLQEDGSLIARQPGESTSFCVAPETGAGSDGVHLVLSSSNCNIQFQSSKGSNIAKSILYLQAKISKLCIGPRIKTSKMPVQRTDAFAVLMKTCGAGVNRFRLEEV